MILIAESRDEYDMMRAVIKCAPEVSTWFQYMVDKMILALRLEEKAEKK
jgi:hypothetical protein